jgi:hypothetical protein
MSLGYRVRRSPDARSESEPPVGDSSYKAPRTLDGAPSTPPLLHANASRPLIVLRWACGCAAVSSLGSTRTTCLACMIFFTPWPFLMAYSIADISTWCDILINELNDTRTNRGPEVHAKIHWLDSALKQLVRSVLTLPKCLHIANHEFVCAV